MPPQQPERRADYETVLEAKFAIDVLRNENKVLNERIEHLERVADQFQELQTSLKTVLWVARVIGALAILLFGDVAKKKLGL